jgi:hypothetical protein
MNFRERVKLALDHFVIEQWAVFASWHELLNIRSINL